MANCPKHGNYSVFCRYCDVDTVSEASKTKEKTPPMFDEKTQCFLPFGKLLLSLEVSRDFGVSYTRVRETENPFSDPQWSAEVQSARNIYHRAIVILVEKETGCRHYCDSSFVQLVPDTDTQLGGAILIKTEYRGRAQVSAKVQELQNKHHKPNSRKKP